MRAGSPSRAPSESCGRRYVGIHLPAATRLRELDIEHGVQLHAVRCHVALAIPWYTTRFNSTRVAILALVVRILFGPTRPLKPVRTVKFTSPSQVSFDDLQKFYLPLIGKNEEPMYYEYQDSETEQWIIYASIGEWFPAVLKAQTSALPVPPGGTVVNGGRW